MNTKIPDRIEFKDVTVTELIEDGECSFTFKCELIDSNVNVTWTEEIKKDLKKQGIDILNEMHHAIVYEFNYSRDTEFLKELVSNISKKEKHYYDDRFIMEPLGVSLLLKQITEFKPDYIIGSPSGSAFLQVMDNFISDIETNDDIFDGYITKLGVIKIDDDSFDFYRMLETSGEPFILLIRDENIIKIEFVDKADSVV